MPIQNRTEETYSNIGAADPAEIQRVHYDHNQISESKTVREISDSRRKELLRQLELEREERRLKASETGTSDDNRLAQVCIDSINV